MDFKMSPGGYEKRFRVSSEPPTFGKYMGFMCVFGILATALYGIVSCSSGDVEGLWWVIFAPIGAPLLGGLLGLILAPIAFPLSRFMHIRRWEKRREKIIAYEKEYIKSATKISSKYAKNELVKKIIHSKTSAFISGIESIERSTYIEELSEEIIISVYVDRVASYSFKEHRLNNIDSIYERTAMAIAIASNIQTNIKEKLKKDPSGTPYKLDINFEWKNYGDKDVVATITYKAENGYYIPEKKW